MSIWMNAALIALICVIVVDISGFIPEMEAVLGRWLGIRKARIPKPLSCSFCLSFWVNLFYGIFSGVFSAGWVAYILFLSVMTPVMCDVVWRLRDFTGTLISNVFIFLTAIINFFKNG